MQDAELNGRLVQAGPDSPQVAQCPACGCEVRKRSRRDGKARTWFYRHRAGTNTDGCPRRYRPVAEG